MQFLFYFNVETDDKNESNDDMQTNLHFSNPRGSPPTKRSGIDKRDVLQENRQRTGHIRVLLFKLYYWLFWSFSKLKMQK